MKKVKVPEAEKLPSGSYRCRVMVNGQKKSFTAPAKREAEQAALEYKIGLLAEENEKPEITIRKAIDEYLTLKSGVLSPASVRGHRIKQRCYLQSIMDIPLSKLSVSAIQQAVNTEKCSPKTIRETWALIRPALKRYGVSYDVSLPAVQSDEHAFLSAEEIPVFLKEAEGSKYEIAFLLALHSLRVSEILGLRWENVDLKKQSITVRGATLFDENNKLVNKPTNKNRSSRRTIPIMIPRLFQLLSDAERTSEFVVIANPNSIRASANKICRKANLPEVGTHGLRHSFCSLAYKLGISEKVTMQLGGWSDYGTMRKIYTHIAQADISDSVQQIKNFFA
jgi:integrase|nr:MAG TPA: Integrase [Caudoviricetes sp.]